LIVAVAGEESGGGGREILLIQKYLIVALIDEMDEDNDAITALGSSEVRGEIVNSTPVGAPDRVVQCSM
jgi:hypothetical protein